MSRRGSSLEERAALWPEEDKRAFLQALPAHHDAEGDSAWRPYDVGRLRPWTAGCREVLVESIRAGKSPLDHAWLVRRDPEDVLAVWRIASWAMGQVVEEGKREMNNICQCGHARSSHGEKPNAACRNERCNCSAFRPRQRALKPLPCRCGGGQQPCPLGKLGDWRVKCYTCFREGPVCRTMTEAIRAWNEERKND